MPITTTCPNCKAFFRLDNDLAGKKVKCQKCQHLFVVPEGDEGTVAPAVSVAIAPQPAPMATAAPPDPVPATVNMPPAWLSDPPTADAENRDRPTGKKPPPIGKRSRDYDDDNDRPSRAGRRSSPAKSGMGTTVLLVLLLGGGLLGCVGCFATVGWFIVSTKDKGKAPVAAADKKKPDPFPVNKDGGNPNPINQDGAKKDGFNPPPKNFPPGGINITLDGTGNFRDNNALNQNDRVDFGRRKKIYTVHLVEGQTYQIDLCSDSFDAYLYLLDDNNQILRDDDDSGGRFSNALNGAYDARIVFRATRTGFYRIHASHFRNGQVFGNYSLIVRRAADQFDVIAPRFP